METSKDITELVPYITRPAIAAAKRRKFICELYNKMKSETPEAPDASIYRAMAALPEIQGQSPETIYQTVKTYRQ